MFEFPMMRGCFARYFYSMNGRIQWCQRYMKWTAASRCVEEDACRLKWDSLFCVYCMCEVSGTCGMCQAFCVHHMCSNYKTFTCWLYLKKKSSHILYASQIQISYLGQCMRGKSSTSTWLTSKVFEYIVTWTQLWSGVKKSTYPFPISSTWPG